MGTNMRDTRQLIAAVASDKKRALIDDRAFFSQMQLLLGAEEWKEVEQAVRSTTEAFTAGENSRAVGALEYDALFDRYEFEMTKLT